MPDVSPKSPGVTQLLLDWRAGDAEALERLMPIVYDELRQLAHHYMTGERPGHELQTTALVHEAYLRLVGLDADWQDRHHFYSLAAGVMRNILVDWARKTRAAKRGGGHRPLSLDPEALEHLQLTVEAPAHLIALDDTLSDLAHLDHRKAKIVELKYFGGLQVMEIATVLELSKTTVERELRLAKAWLGDQLASER